MRRTPAQNRARTTVDRILDAAAALLEDEGLPGFNTNAISTRAALTVPALYRYFGNKEAVLVALSERYVAAEQDWLDGIERLGDAREPLEGVVASFIRGYARAADAYPAISPLRAAMRALPELTELEERSLSGTSERLAAALARRAPELTTTECRTAARLVVETVCNAIDRSRRLPTAERQRRLDALGQLVTSYLSSLGQ